LRFDGREIAILDGVLGSGVDTRHSNGGSGAGPYCLMSYDEASILLWSPLEGGDERPLLAGSGRRPLGALEALNNGGYRWFVALIRTSTPSPREKYAMDACIRDYPALTGYIPRWITVRLFECLALSPRTGERRQKLLTVWRWMQSAANRSPRKNPCNRDLYWDFTAQKYRITLPPGLVISL
jgi:hypothetical protein